MRTAIPRLCLVGLFGFVLCGAAVISGCLPDNVNSIAKRLKGVGRHLDEFGSVSVSSPLFADLTDPATSQAFEFKLSTTAPWADRFYDDARRDVHGRVGAMLQDVRESNFGFQGQVDIQTIMLNMIKMSQFYDAQDAFHRKQMMNDLGQYLGLIVPGIDPRLIPTFEAPVTPDATTQSSSSPTTTPNGQPTTSLPITANPLELPKEVQDAITAIKRLQELQRQLQQLSVGQNQETTIRLNELIKALLATSSGLSGPSSQPALPELKGATTRPYDPNLLAKFDDLRKILVDESKFQRFLGLLPMMFTPTTQPVVSNRSALITAGGDNTVKGIFQFLGKPELAPLFRDKIVLLGVSMVSCTPGTRTAKGYVADVSVAVSYDYQPVRQQVLKELLDRNDRHTWLVVHTLKAIKTHNSPVRREAEQIRQSRAKLEEVAKDQAGSKGEINDLDLQTSERLAQVLVDQANRQISMPGISNYNRVRASHAPAYLAGQDYPNIFSITDYFQAGGSGLLSHVPPAPTVAAVSPMTDVQTLDLASSVRSQQAFALRLALIVTGFGVDAEGQALLRHIRQFEQDAITRTPMNTVAGYSNSGGVFGYQVGPSLVGLAAIQEGGRDRGLFEPRIRPGPGMVLQRQSFPALVFVGVDRDDLALQLRHDPLTSEWTIVEPRLQFRQTTRWIPIAPGTGAGPFTKLSRPYVSEADRVKWANELRQATNAVDHLALEGEYRSTGGKVVDADPSTILDSPADAAFKDFVRSRIAVLHAHALEAYHYQAIPMTAFLDKVQLHEARQKIEAKTKG